MKAIRQLTAAVGDLSLTGLTILLLVLSAIVLPACGFQFSDLIPVDTPQPLVEHYGFDDSMALTQAREMHQLWRAEFTIADQEWAMRVADAEGTAAILEGLSLQALATAEGAAGSLGGGPLGGLLLGALGAGGGYLQGSKRQRRKNEREQA